MFCFSRTWARNICKFVFVWIVNWTTFQGYFFPPDSTKISDYAERAEPTLCKNLFRNPDFEAKQYFRVNSYHTSAKVQSIPLTIQLYLAKISVKWKKTRINYDFFSSPVIAWLNEGLATGAHSNWKKHEQHKPTLRSKSRRIIASELNLEWEHLSRTFLTWFRRKNELGGLEKRTKEKTEQTA